MCTKFAVDNSSRFSVRARTNRRTNRQTDTYTDAYTDATERPNNING